LYKVMIVEDEILVRMGLKNSVQWDKFNMSVTSEAVNGQMAWEVFESDRPDVVITDLRMPIMDGMSLIKEIREVDKDCRIIILTCVEEFENARKAITYDVSDYILKLTMTWDDIEKVLSRVREELDKLYGGKHAVEDPKSQVEAEKENLLDYLTCSESFDPEVFNRRAAGLMLNIKPESLVICIMSLPEESRFLGPSNKEHKRIKNLSIYNMISENFKRVFSGEIFCENERKYVMILNIPDGNSGIETTSSEKWKAELREELEHIGNIIKMYLNIQPVFGVSSRSEGYGSLRMLHNEALSALNGKFFKGTAKTFLYDEKPDKDKMYGLLLHKIEELVVNKQISEKKGEADIGIIKEKIAGFFEQHPFNAENVRRLFYKLGSWTVSPSRITEEEVEAIQYSYMSSIFKCEVMEEMIAVYSRYLDELEKIMCAAPNLSRETNGAIAYINRNYMQNLSLGQLAQKVNISQGYLCSIFKKELGTSFSDYLLRVRINKSKEMLVSTFMKLYEISESVGFSDYSYFSRAFKKVTGMRPQKYRELWGYTVDGDETDENN
jgi:two-component system response regulator YesN